MIASISLTNNFVQVAVIFKKSEIFARKSPH